MEPAEGSRETVTGDQTRERDRHPVSERNRESDATRTGNSGGITNRPLDRERCEQEQIPERGQSQSER